MSRLWNRPRLRVYMGEDYLALCLVSGRWSPRVHQLAQLPLVSGQGGAVASVLDAWMTANPLRGVMQSAVLELVVGMPHVRYVLLPWDRQLVQDDFRHAMARALFARQFQQDFSTQELRFGALKYGRPLLAACIDRTLVEMVSVVARQHDTSVSCIEPLLATVWSRFHSRLKGAEGTLLLAEASRVHVVRCKGGAITELQIRPGTEDDISGMVLQLASNPDCRVFAPLLPGLASSLPNAWLGLEAGEGFSVVADAQYAYALSGVF